MGTSPQNNKQGLHVTIKNRLIYLSCLSLFLSIMNAYGQALEISHGPYLQNITESEATVVWTTNKDSYSWVEFYEEDGSGFYEKQRPKVFASEDGLKRIGKIHKVTLEGLNPATKYAYRIYSKEVTVHKNENSLLGETVATDVFQQEPLKFSTLNPNQENTSFVLMTDLHENSEKIEKLLEDTNFDKTDFVIIDGDFMNDFSEERDLFEGSLDTFTNIFAKETPLYVVRGNHETRGAMSHKLKDYFHFPNGKYHYSFNYGDSFFIVLDGGEDKPDSDIEYSGLVDFDSYRTREAIWLKSVVNSPAFKSAKHKIVFSHIPPYGGGNWHGDRESRVKFVPILNQAGIDLMIAGHTHSYSFVPADKSGRENSFPILICSNNAKVNVEISSKGITATTVDLNKKTISKLKFN